MPDYPGYQPIDFNNLPGGVDIFQSLMQKYKTGLDPRLRAMYLKRGRGMAGANLAEGKQDLAEALAGEGDNVPIDALIEGKSKLQVNANKAVADVNDSVLEKDNAAMDKALAGYFALLGSGSQEAQARNAFNQNKVNYDNANEQDDFDWGAAAGGALEAAGTVAGAGVKAGTCFCYAEVFGTSSKEFVYARKWGVDNTSESVKKGYIKLSAILIPLMRKFPKFKLWFKEHIAEPCLKQMKITYEDKFRIRLKLMIALCYVIGKVARLNKRDSKILLTVFVNGRNNLRS